MIDDETGQIIGVYEEKGSVHDLEIFGSESNKLTCIKERFIIKQKQIG